MLSNLTSLAARNITDECRDQLADFEKKVASLLAYDLQKLANRLPGSLSSLERVSKGGSLRKVDFLEHTSLRIRQSELGKVTWPTFGKSLAHDRRLRY
jgi:hypothetical protein